MTQFKGQGGHLTRHFIADILSPDSPLNLSTTNKEEEGGDGEAEETRKKPRTSFNGWQIYELEKLFEEKKYISNEERKTFARSVSHNKTNKTSVSLNIIKTLLLSFLGVSTQQLKVWFQNRRTKWKRDENIPNDVANKLMKSLR